MELWEETRRGGERAADETGRLDGRTFASPPARLRGVPFWAWNCAVTPELVDRQLEAFAQMGFGGVIIHPRVGLDTPYLGEEYMRLVRRAACRCEAMGLSCWIYDDDRFPSGAADGFVTREPRFRQRCLLLTERRRTGCCADAAAFARALEAGETPEGYYAASYAVTLRDGCLAAYRRVAADEPARPGERVRHAYVLLSPPEDYFEGQTYVDVMNPEAIRRFIGVTHEAYARALGDALGATVTAFFTDEPRLGLRGGLSGRLKTPDSREDVALPFSEGLAGALRAEGVELFDALPELVWDLPEGRPSVARYRFRDAACERFVSAFLDPIGAWCEAHGVRATGHVLGEDTLFAQADMLGEAMRCYRGMHLPGVDILCDFRQFATVKQASSVAHQFGREGVMSEEYGVTRWTCDFKTYKLQGDWQAALGVTARVPHLCWMSMAGEAKRDWPASIFTQSPWWRRYGAVEDHFARLNAALTRGTPAIDVALVHPVESVWLHFGPVSRHERAIRAADAAFETLVNALLLGGIDFDFLSESLLPGQGAHAEAGRLTVGAMRYRVAVVPPMETIRGTTLDVLEAFADAGGAVIFLGGAAGLVDARPSDRAARLAARCARAADVPALLRALDGVRRFRVTGARGEPADGLLSQLRLDGDAQWLFLCHAFAGRGEPAAAEDVVVRLPGACRATVYDTLRGETRPAACRFEGGETLIDWRAYAEDSLLLRIEPGEPCARAVEPPVYEAAACLHEPDAVRFDEPNMLPLDYACARMNGGAWTEKTEILRLDNALRAALGFPPRDERMRQPWATAAGEGHALTLRYEIDAACATPCRLGIERGMLGELTLNGARVPLKDTGFYVDEAIRAVELGALKPGRNVLTLSLRFDRRTNLESLYLLGNFGVARRPAGESRATARALRVRLGSLTEQGMPFYTGNTDYDFALDIAEAGAYAVRVPEFAAPVLEVWLDGRPCGLIAYAPHRAPLGRLEAGRHRLTIRAYGHRHNGFGALHNAAENFVWYGPAAYRTQGDAWTDDYRVEPLGLLSPVIVERERDGARPNE